jgi:iron complex transport system permease protein
MKTVVWIGAGVLAVFGLITAALMSGPLGVEPRDLTAALFGQGSDAAELALALRAPRLIAAAVTGAALAGAGAGFQILFRNPLVAPDLLGVSSGAGLGAAVVLLAGGGAMMVHAGAFVGGVASAGLALTCAALARTGDARLSLVLCGLVVSALASAGLGLVAILAEPYSQLPTLTYWLLGSFSRATLSEALLALAPTVFGGGVLLWLGFRLDALSLGDEQARALGLPAEGLRMIAVAAATLMTSAAVAISGVVGWIGLLAPHAARRLVGPQADRLLPAAMAMGALFGLAIDRLSTAFGPAELPVGLLAAGVGAPAFLILLVMTARREP